MNRTQATGDASFSGDTLLAAYQLLIESTVESSADDVLLQRALAVVAAIPWPSPHRFFSAFLLAPDGGSLCLAAIATGAGAPPPPCADLSSASCLCGRALVHQERLLCVTATAAERLPCDPDGTGTHLILPLAARGRVWGALHAVLESKLPPDRIEQSFLVQVATLLGAELHRRRSEREHDRLEMQFLQAQKMEAVGRLAGGVAHDFNNILTAITNYADLGLLRLPAENTLRRYFEEIIAASDRAALLTQQLLAFSRRQVLAPRAVDVNTIIAGLGKTLRRLLGADIELSIRTNAELPPIMADPALIEQLVINLTVSARDAMSQGGAIVIATTGTRFDASYTLIHPTVAPGDYICLTVGAHGPGMDADYLNGLGGFGDATQETRTGVTLGPAAVNDIIQQGGGHARIETTPASGSTVSIYFPAVNATAAVPYVPDSTFNLPRGDETVLLAEDDDSVRVVMGEVLRDLGYQVLEAREGRGALDIAAGHCGRIDILLTDVIMPGFGGNDLYRHLLATRADLRVLYISGVIDEVGTQRGPVDPGVVSLQKPFSPWSLAALVRQVLDAPPTVTP